MTRYLKIFAPLLLVMVMASLVAWSNLRGRISGSNSQSEPEASRRVDPVCNMEINPAWGFLLNDHDQNYYFCSERCRDLFAADPNKYLADKCIVCGDAVHLDEALPVTYLGKTYHVCSEEDRAKFKTDPAAYFMHRMWGIPDWLYYVSIGLVLLASFLMFEGADFIRRRFVGLRLRPENRRNSQSEFINGAETSVQEANQRRRPLASMIVASMRRSPRCRDQSSATSASSTSLTLPVVGPSRSLERAVHSVLDGRKHPPVPNIPSVKTDRIDLLKFKWVRFLLTARPLRFVVQLIMAFAFIIIVAAGLFGNQNPALNIAPLLTWTLWWCGLVVLILFLGKAWCWMCPWDAIARWMERMRFWKKSNHCMGLDMKWPRALRNIWLATVLFIGLTWIELGFGVTISPRVTAYVAIGMLLLTIVSAFLFDRQSFCRYGCLVGRVSGLYAMFGGIEIRSRSEDVCKTCKTKECIKGSETAYACPTFEYPGKMNVNTYCIQCCECIQSCPHENMTVNLRPWGADLAADGKQRTDEAYLALLMLAISGFHGLTMTPVWNQLTTAIESGIPFGSTIAFSLGMFGLMLIPIVIYAALVWMSYFISTRARQAAVVRKGNSLSYWNYFVRYAYCVLPIALFYHLAHNLEHLLMEGPKVIKLASDPFGSGANYFGTAGWNIPPMVSLDVLWIMQVLLIGVGHVYSLWAANRISRNMFSDEKAALRGQWSMLIGMIAFSIFSLWLLKQPMEMRTSTM